MESECTVSSLQFEGPDSQSDPETRVGFVFEFFIVHAATEDPGNPRARSEGSRGEKIIARRKRFSTIPLDDPRREKHGYADFARSF